MLALSTQDVMPMEHSLFEARALVEARFAEEARRCRGVQAGPRVNVSALQCLHAASLAASQVIPATGYVRSFARKLVQPVSAGVLLLPVRHDQIAALGAWAVHEQETVPGAASNGGGNQAAQQAAMDLLRRNPSSTLPRG